MYFEPEIFTAVLINVKSLEWQFEDHPTPDPRLSVTVIVPRLPVEFCELAALTVIVVREALAAVLIFKVPAFTC